MLYVHRYIRLTPSVGAIILFSLFIFPHLASGPYWMGGVDDFDSWYVLAGVWYGVCLVVVVQCGVHCHRGACVHVWCACVRACVRV
jgi:hypothetical protein